MSFGSNLRRLRRNRGLTQQQVADSLGITKATYSGYETDRREPDVFKIKALAKLFGVSGDELLETGYENKTPKPEKIDLGDDRYEILGQKIYETLLSCGYVEEGQDLTDAQIDFLDGLSAIISAYFNGSAK